MSLGFGVSAQRPYSIYWALSCHTPACDTMDITTPNFPTHAASYSKFLSDRLRRHRHHISPGQPLSTFIWVSFRNYASWFSHAEISPLRRLVLAPAIVRSTNAQRNTMSHEVYILRAHKAMQIHFIFDFLLRAACWWHLRRQHVMPLQFLMTWLPSASLYMINTFSLNLFTKCQWMYHYSIVFDIFKFTSLRYIIFISLIFLWNATRSPRTPALITKFSSFTLHHILWDAELIITFSQDYFHEKRYWGVISSIQRFSIDILAFDGIIRCLVSRFYFTIWGQLVLAEHHYLKLDCISSHPYW